jgi:stearoyl-CoA desaturase (Delta-9 desaturase)
MKTVPHAALYKNMVIAGVIIPLLGVVIAIILTWNHYVFWQDISLLVSLYLLTGLGITVGYHRMLTHDGFQTYRPIRMLLLILGCMAFEGPPHTWAATHICHHANSDKEGDPHSPIEGFWHAHLGWILRIDYEDPAVWVPHLRKDPVVMFVSRTCSLWMILSLAIPFLLGGWTGFLWGGLVRIFLVNHITWSVNSVCHTFGKQPFDVHDHSRNEWIVGLLAFGEGWHNNHHAFPKNAFHGLYWWQFDLSGLLIRGLEKMHMIWRVERVQKDLVEAKRRSARNAKEILANLHQQLGDLILNATEAHPLIAKRLEEIRDSLSESSSLQKKKLQKYGQEVREIASRLQHAQA